MVRRLNEQASGSTKIDMNVKVNILHIHFKSMAVQKLMIKSRSTSSQRRPPPQQHLQMQTKSTLIRWIICQSTSTAQL